MHRLQRLSPLLSGAWRIGGVRIRALKPPHHGLQREIVSNTVVSPNPTLFRTREASKPYSRGQWDTALKATPHSPYGRCFVWQGLRVNCALGCPRLPVSRSSLTGDGTQLLSETPENLGVQLRKTNGLAFWTLSLWQTIEAMKKFMFASPHKEAMQRLPRWCNAASFADWEQNKFASWDQAADKLRASGRLAKVLHPSIRHKAGKIETS